MHYKQTVFITAAVLMMAALAGVLVMDGADATETEDSYTLTYHVGAETESATQPTPAFTVLDVDELTKLTVPDGKVFDGWFTQPDGKGTAYAKGSTYTIQGTGVTTGDLYAKLSDAPAQTVTVKFNIEGTVYTQTLTVTDGQIVLPTISALGANVPAGQEFKGWSNGGTTYAAGSAMTAPAKDTEFKAVFQDIVYTVTFDIDGTKTTVSGTAADSVAFPADPVKEGMTFKGWSVDGKMVESTAGIKFSANVTYVAVFVEDFGLTFEVNGTTYAADKTLADVFMKHISNPFCPAFVYTAKHPEALIAQVGETPVRMKLYSVWNTYPRTLVSTDANGNTTLDQANFDKWLTLMEECGVENREELRLTTLLDYTEKKADWTAYVNYLTEYVKATAPNDLFLCKRCTPVAENCKDEALRKQVAAILQQRVDDLKSGKRQPQTQIGNMKMSGNMGKVMEMLIQGLETGEMPKMR